MATLPAESHTAPEIELDVDDLEFEDDDDGGSTYDEELATCPDEELGNLAAMEWASRQLSVMGEWKLGKG